MKRIINNFLNKYFDDNTLVYMFREVPPCYVLAREAPVWAKLIHLFYWRVWDRFERSMIKYGLHCEYCRKFGICHRQEKVLKHKLGEMKVGGMYHRKCFEDSWDFYIKHMSGKTAVCIDCNREFYLSHRPGEDCPVKGMARDHRIKGEENMLML